MPGVGRYTAEQLQEFVDEFLTTEMSMTAFCKTKDGLATSTFSKALKAHQRADKRARHRDAMRALREKRRTDPTQEPVPPGLPAALTVAVAAASQTVGRQAHVNDVLRQENAALKNLLALQWAQASGR